MMIKKDITPEEAIVELRAIVESFGGLDPRYGSVIKPIQPISEEDTERFLNQLFVRYDWQNGD